MGHDLSKLDANQVIQDVHDVDNHSLRTNATLVVPGGIEVAIDQADDSIAIGDGTTLFTGTTDGGKHALDVQVNGGNINVPDLTPPAEYKILNLSMPAANTEYNFSLPNTAKRMEMKLRDGKGPLRVYEVSSGTNYFTVERGSRFVSGNIKPTTLDFYIQSSQASCTLEIIYWE